MEVILGLALILAVNEWRDHKRGKKHRQLILKISQISRKLHMMEALTLKIDEAAKAQDSLRASIEPLRDFILRAETDLSTIVKEYRVNGVPLGYDRGGPDYDAIEGV